MSQTVLVTGATRGCGRAMVDRFAEAGHTVVGCGRTKTVVDELRERFPTPHRFDVVDVADSRHVEKWSADVLAAGLVPDLLINNAAIMNRPAPLWEITADEFAMIMGVNVNGTANVLRQFVPSMIEKGAGTIVNFSSGWGRSTAPEVAPYCTTKFAIEGLSNALAQELPPGMVCVALNPGIINTEMLQTCWSDGANAYPSPEEWSRRAVPFILGLRPADNGRSVDVPGR